MIGVPLIGLTFKSLSRMITVVISGQYVGLIDRNRWGAGDVCAFLLVVYVCREMDFLTSLISL